MNNRSEIDRLKRELLLALLRTPADDLIDLEADILCKLTNERTTQMQLEIA